MPNTETLHLPPLPNLPRVPERTPGKEKSWVNKLGTAIGDTISDIGTASDMAKDKFEGDSALMHAARGGLTTLLGIGLEKAIDGMWQKGFQGLEPISQRPWLEISPEAIKALEKIGEKYPAVYRFAREGSKDVVTGMLYNGIAFFSRPMFPSIEGKHLVRSTLVNALESVIESPEYIREDIRLAPINRKTASNMDKKSVDTSQFQKNDVQRSPWRENSLRILGLSNPATQLGADMITTAFSTLKRNYDEVQKARKEKGGMPGKKVEMPNSGGYGDRKYYGNKREYGNKPQYNKDKVYYGKSQWNMSPQQEEEDRAKSM